MTGVGHHRMALLVCGLCHPMDLWVKMKMTITMEKNYIKQADNYLEDYEDAMKERKLQQASEKLWGAASQIVKAYAQKKDWVHNGHRELFKVVDKISRESEDAEMKNQFSIASALHQNFYEGWLTKGEITENAKVIKEFVDKLKLILCSRDDEKL